MMRDFESTGGHQSRSITVFRGQKNWDETQPPTAPVNHLSAASMRRGWGSSAEMAQFTDHLLRGFRYTLRDAGAGDARAISRLEKMLLGAQMNVYENPFVSCTFDRGIALSFAVTDNTTGYLLTITGDWYDGVDFEYLRSRLRYWGDAVDHLKEFGIGKELHPPFQIVRVEEVSSTQAPRQVYP